MKKLISIVLSLALVACMFGMSVMAGTADAPEASSDVTYNIAYRVVGAQGKSNTLVDGVERFENESITGDVVFELSGSVKNRYAVDITFTSLSFEMGGDLTWDVNNYVYQGDSTFTSPTVNVSVTNHSDLAVNFTIKFDAVSDYKDLIASVSETTATVVESAAPDTLNGEGKAKTQTASVSVAPVTDKTWNDVLPTLMQNISDGKVTVGSVIVTVKPGSADSSET